MLSLFKTDCGANYFILFTWFFIKQIMEDLDIIKQQILVFQEEYNIIQFSDNYAKKIILHRLIRSLLKESIKIKEQNNISFLDDIKELKMFHVKSKSFKLLRTF